jgi:hypothetical protein
MIAALVLLNQLFAARAGLGISENPGHVFTLRFVLQRPLF